MEEIKTCCEGSGPRLITACSGRSNVGQIANRVMVEMDKMGIAASFCLAGVGAGLSGFVESARAGKVILVDGCPVGCGKKIFENNSAQPERYFVVTELGVQKGNIDARFEDDSKFVLGNIMANI